MLKDFFRKILRAGKLNPNNCDLRHFHWIQWSETWDGTTSCSDGWTHRVLLYRGDSVYTASKFRAYGSAEGRNYFGNAECVTIARVADIYMHIVKYVRHVAQVEQNFVVFPQGKKQEIFLPPEAFKMLTEHPQFAEINLRLGEIEWSFRLEQGNENKYEIIVENTIRTAA